VREIILFGGPGGAAIVAQSVFRLASAGGGLRLLGFLDDALRPGTQVCGAPVLGPFEAWREQPERVSFLAPLHKAKEMQRRATRIHSLEIPDARWDRVIDPAAFVATDATIDRGSFVAPFAVVDTQVRVGRFVSMWPGAQVGHQSVIGDFVFFGRAAVVSAYCEVQEGAHIGPSAVVHERSRIGRYAVVGAGAVVLEDVPDHAIVAGNPARLIGRLDPHDDPA
jgi:sugar O-acyltransferase (sialic acid O-acetyltransferase NeuD family)